MMNRVVIMLMSLVCSLNSFGFSADGYEWEVVGENEVRCDGFVYRNEQAIANIPAAVKNSSNGKQYTCTQVYSFSSLVVEEVFIPSTTNVVMGNWSRCEKLREIHFPAECRLDAFEVRGCKSLERIHFPKGNEFVPSECCKNCPSLTTVIIPDGYTSIQDGAFQDCPSLKAFYVYALIPPIIYEDVFLLTSRGSESGMKLYVPRESVDLYMNSDWAKYFSVISPVEESGLEDVVYSEKSVVGRYDLQGHEVDEDYDGVMIVKCSDGSAKKIVSKR